MTLYEKVESTDDYPRWKAVYDAWVDDPTTAINLRDMAGEYFDDFMVAVEPTHRICTTHDNLELPGRPGICAETGYLNAQGKKSECVIVDAWIGEPA